MEERWYCPDCGKEFEQPLRRWLHDDGLTATPEDLCPGCYSAMIEQMEECPSCDGGWRRKSERVCHKCHLRNLAALQRFARSFVPAALADLDDILDGNGLEMFV